MKNQAILKLEEYLNKYTSAPDLKNYNDLRIVYAFQQLKIEYNAAEIPQNNYCANFLSINKALDLAELMGIDDLVNRKLYKMDIAEFGKQSENTTSSVEDNPILIEEGNESLGAINTDNDCCCVIN